MKYEDGKYYHLYNRGANKANIFLSHENYLFCIQIFSKYTNQFKISILAYCLMPNHYHLLIRQNEGGSISKFIQTVFNSYTQALNTAAGRSGTLFQGRVKGKEITTDEYAVRLCRYIHANPVAADLVKKPEDWEFSDYLEWIGKRNGSLTDFSLRDGYFGNASSYEKFVEEYNDDMVLLEFIFNE